MERWISLLGLVVMVGLAWLMSWHRWRVKLRVVIGGLVLQFVFAFFILRTDIGLMMFDWAGDVIRTTLEFVDTGSSFLFDFRARQLADDPAAAGEEAGKIFRYQLISSFAFRVLPTIVFFSSLMSVLYYLGIMQWVVRLFAWVMQRTLGTSGAETLSAAANIFVGQTEAPLVVRPYVPGMTMSELNVVMVGGFATIAGGVLAVFVQLGIDPTHLLTASVISAPAALLIAKVMVPEVDEPQTMGHVPRDESQRPVNVIEAAADGAAQGLKLALNVAAMLLAFVALIAMLDALLGWTGRQIGEWIWGRPLAWSLEAGFGYLFAPFAWLMGIPYHDCLAAGRLLGTKTVVNEFLAYVQLSQIVHADMAAAEAGRQLSQRSVTILTYALCGFSNFGSIGIQLGGIGGIAPTRRSDLARLGLRAMIGGTLACFMTACVAGILIA